MSYAMGASLQKAVHARLVADMALAALVGPEIHDSVPPGAAAGTYVSLGPEDARDASDKTTDGAWHDFVVSVVSDEPGFLTVKQVAEAVSDALVGAELMLERGHLVGLWFQRARARRVQAGAMRRIDLYFRARVCD
jgi:hypothetical protein